MVLEIPQLPLAASPSSTLSTRVPVNAYPASGTLASISGSLLLDSKDAFIFNNERVCQQELFASLGTPSTGSWHNVVVIERYEEARLALFIDGQIDNLYDLSNAGASVSAILPTVLLSGSLQPAPLFCSMGLWATCSAVPGMSISQRCRCWPS